MYFLYFFNSVSDYTSNYMYVGPTGDLYMTDSF